MPIVADYAAVQDQAFTLGGKWGPLTADFEFSLPSNFNRESRCILAFMVLDVIDVDHIKIDIAINGNIMRSLKYSEDFRLDRAIHEIFNADKIGPGQKSSVNFSVANQVGDDSAVVISDVVVWYRVNV